MPPTPCTARSGATRTHRGPPTRARSPSPATAPERRRSTSWKFPRALLDLQNFLFLDLGGLVDLLHVPVGQLLNLVVSPLVLVFGDLLVLEQRLDGLVAVAANVAQRHAMVLGDAVQALDELLAALLGEGRDGKPDQLAIVGRIQAQVGDANGFF